MVETNPVRVAGIGLSWDENRAKEHAAKLIEMGFYAKRLPVGDKALVCYCYRPFTPAEALQTLARLSD